MQGLQKCLKEETQVWDTEFYEPVLEAPWKPVNIDVSKPFTYEHKNLYCSLHTQLGDSVLVLKRVDQKYDILQLTMNSIILMKTLPSVDVILAHEDRLIIDDTVFIVNDKDALETLFYFNKQRITSAIGLSPFILCLGHRVNGMLSLWNWTGATYSFHQQASFGEGSIDTMRIDGQGNLYCLIGKYSVLRITPSEVNLATSERSILYNSKGGEQEQISDFRLVGEKSLAIYYNSQIKVVTFTASGQQIVFYRKLTTPQDKVVVLQSSVLQAFCISTSQGNDIEIYQVNPEGKHVCSKHQNLQKMTLISSINLEQGNLGLVSVTSTNKLAIQKIYCLNYVQQHPPSLPQPQHERFL